MSEFKESAPAVGSNQGHVRTEESNSVSAQGGPLSSSAVWSVENLRVGENWSIVAGRIQVAVCARRDIALAICDAMNERRVLREDFTDRLGLFAAEGQARILTHMLHLLERRGVE